MNAYYPSPMYYILSHVYIFVQSQLWAATYIFRVGKTISFSLHLSVLGEILAAVQIDLLEASFFQLSLSPTVVINCVTLSGPSGLNDGGDQEEDASHEGGEGQPDGPL